MSKDSRPSYGQGGANCKYDDSDNDQLNEMEFSFATNIKALKKLGKSDIQAIRAKVDKYSKRALADFKFCNTEDEENDTVFEWCVQVVTAVIEVLPHHY